MLARLSRIIRRPTTRLVPTGIGDDCAAVRAAGPGRLLLLKTDAVVEKRHFHRSDPPRAVGWKAACRAVSDIAACGGRPAHALITCVVREEQAGNWLTELYRGIEKAGKKFGFYVVGGELARTDGPAVVNVAMTGEVEAKRFVRRDGGRPGDALFVTGMLGGSLKSGRHLRFQPRLEEARWLTQRFRIRAMMDLSDGLAADLPRLAAACKTGFAVDVESVPRHAGASLEAALGDGEDFELLFALSPDEAPALKRAWRRRFARLRLTQIGSLAPHGVAIGLGSASGYDHFAS